MITVESDVILDDPHLCVVRAFAQSSSEALFAILSDGSLAVLCPTENHVLTLASKTPIANQLPVDRLVRRDAEDKIIPVTAVACHPFIEYLSVIGFQDGTYAIWLPSDPNPAYNGDFHSAPISTIRWLACGQLLVTCDTMGLVNLYTFSTGSLILEQVTSLHRSGAVVDVIERTSCTENVICVMGATSSGDGPIDLSTYVGLGFFECIIAWEGGEIVVLTDNGNARQIDTVPLSAGGAGGKARLEALFYWACSDTYCVVSTHGDVFTYGFKALIVGSQKTKVPRSKIEYLAEAGIVRLPGLRLGFLTPSGGQVRILNVLTQEAIYADLETAIDGFQGTNGPLTVIDGFGLIVSLKGLGGYAVVTRRPGKLLVEAFDQAEMYTYAASKTYLHANDRRYSRPLPLGASPPHGLDSIHVTERHTVRGGRGGPLQNVFVSQVSLGSNADLQILITAYDPRDSGSVGAASHYASLLRFSFEPKDLQVSYANKTNGVIFTQDLSGEPLTKPSFLDQQFMSGRNSFLTAVLTGSRTFRVSINTADGRLQEHDLEATFPIKKLSTLVDMKTAVELNNLAGFALAFGDNSFAVFRVTVGQAPTPAGAFHLDERYSYVADCALFGNYILASQNSRDDLDAEYSRVEIVKYSFTGKRTERLILNEDPTYGRIIDRVARITLVNRHLFMVDNSLRVFCTDCKELTTVIYVANVMGMLLDVTSYSASEVKPEGLLEGDPNACARSPRSFSVSNTLSPLIPLDSICVQACNSTVTLDDAHHIDLSIVLKGYNMGTGLSSLLPYIVCIRVDERKVNQLLLGEGASLAEMDEVNSSVVISSRIFDFAPYTVVSANIDCFGTLGTELVLAPSLNAPFIGCGLLAALKLGIASRQELSTEFLERKLDSLGPDDDQDSSDLVAALCSLCEAESEQRRVALFLQCLHAEVMQQDRIYAGLHDHVDKTFLSVQGVFEPYINSRLERTMQPLTSTLLTLLSPAFVFLERVQNPDEVATNVFSAIVSDKITMRSLTMLGTLNRVGLQQSCTTTYALNKFVVCIANGQITEAYAFVLASENPQVWRSLAILCIKNEYVGLLKTCISHLRSPLLSLLLRSALTGCSRLQDLSMGPGMGGANEKGAGGRTKVSAQDQQLIALMGLALGEATASGPQLHARPLQLTRLLNEAGLATEVLASQGPHSLTSATSGLVSLARKGSVLALADRLAYQGDVNGANRCYSEVYGGTANALDIDTLSMNPQAIMDADKDVQRVRTEYRENGPEACADLAKRINTSQALYQAARLVEEAARAKDTMEYWLEAARLFNLCHAHSHALICAIRCQADELIYSIAMASHSQRLGLVAAAYFSDRYRSALAEAGEKMTESEYERLQDYVEKALVLYKTAGLGAQSIELCLKSNRMRELASLLNEFLCSSDASAKEEGGDTVPGSDSRETAISDDLLIRSGRALLDTNPDDYSLEDYNKFIQVATLALARAHAFEEALKIITEGRIRITEQLADVLTPTSRQLEDDPDAKGIVETLGKLLLKAGLYGAATKKFILVQNYQLATTALVKLGDADRIIKFAKAARQKQVYIAAANFLQTQDWRGGGHLPVIVSFYEKANALELIAKFFAHCCAEEILEFHDYMKAKSAILECVKRQRVALEYVEAGASAKESERVAAARAAKIEALREALRGYELNAKLINAFLQLCDFARDTTRSHDGADTLQNNATKLLTAVEQTEGCYVQKGDIYGLLAEFHAARGERGRVSAVFREMVRQGIRVEDFIDSEMYRTFSAELGTLAPTPSADFEEIQLGAEESEQ